MRLYLTVILAISFLENFQVHIIKGTLGTQALPHNSCIDLRTKEIGIKKLADYEIHHHPKKVVILITRKKIKICVPPDAPWVNKII
ncbi:lymphotactin-like [Crotalus adamanteus]|uniref:Lymphotactin-like n=1 Tax=Crotalus adamanteus TaxID=8729 RepID=A0AAW1BKD6_CROAD